MFVTNPIEEIFKENVVFAKKKNIYANTHNWLWKGAIV